MERGSVDRLEAMSTVLAVVEAGSLSAAARRLNTLARDLWTFVRSEAPIPVRSRLIVSNPEAARDAAQAGVGITMVFSLLVEEALAARELVTILEGFEPPAMPVNLVYTAGRFLPIKLRAFLDFATPRLKARLLTPPPPVPPPSPPASQIESPTAPRPAEP
jgi:DNA-binding transcriptional LysR family regulator